MYWYTGIIFRYIIREEESLSLKRYKEIMLWIHQLKNHHMPVGIFIYYGITCPNKDIYIYRMKQAFLANIQRIVYIAQQNNIRILFNEK